MRLTDQAVKRLPAPKRGNKVTFDDVVKSFGCRVTAAGQRAFVLNYRRKVDGRQRQITLSPGLGHARRPRRDQALKTEGRWWRRPSRGHPVEPCGGNRGRAVRAIRARGAAAQPAIDTARLPSANPG